MIIDHSTAISYMTKDMEYFYYDLVDLKNTSNNITLFSDSLDDLANHQFVLVTVYDDEILIDIHSDNISLISDAISFAKEKGIPTIYLAVENDRNVSLLTSVFSIEISNDQDHKHWGIFGAIKNIAEIEEHSDILVISPSQNDIDFIATLPSKEWAFLPNRIKFLKNILIAKNGNDLLGYLVYDSIELGHYDIVMVYVHPNHRRLGVASTLIKVYAMECLNKNGVPYYVCANSEGSGKLAKALNIPEMRKETVIYKLN